jgi:hypothetical protein
MNSTWSTSEIVFMAVVAFTVVGVIIAGTVVSTRSSRQARGQRNFRGQRYSSSHSGGASDSFVPGFMAGHFMHEHARTDREQRDQAAQGGDGAPFMFGESVSDAGTHHGGSGYSDYGGSDSSGCSGGGDGGGGDSGGGDGGGGGGD